MPESKRFGCRIVFSVAMLILLGLAIPAMADDFVPQAQAITLGNPISGQITGQLTGAFTFNSDGVVLDWNLTVTTALANYTFTPSDSRVTIFCCYNGQTTTFGPPTSITFSTTTTNTADPFFNSWIEFVLPGTLAEGMADQHIAANQLLQLVTSNTGGGSTSPINSTESSYVQTNLCNLDGFCQATRLMTPSYLSLSDPPNAIYTANLTNGTSAAPEPSSFLLFGTGLIGAIGTLRRRFRR